MANVKISNLTTTWNSASYEYSGIKLNATDTLSSGSSKLINLQKDGTTVFSVDKNGVVTGTVNTSSYSINSVPKLRYIEDWIPAGAMTPATTSGPAAAVTVASSSLINYDTLAFDGASPEMAYFNYRIPSTWDKGNIKTKFIWDAAVSGSGSVVWGISSIARSDGDVIDNVTGTEVTSSDTVQAVGRIHISPSTADMTVSGSPATDDLMFFKLRRITSDTGDTMTQDALLLGITLQWREGSTEPSVW